jgi:molybdopterin-guanine dinucleotide biosynthesis protein A
VNRRAGIVLCGGRSRRMGRPKAWLPIGRELMLQRVVRLLASAVDPVIVVAAPEQVLPPIPESVVIQRDPEEGQGPLRGIAVGLNAAFRLECSGAFVSACDLPFLQPGFVRFLFDQLISDRAVCAPNVGGFIHPLAAVYRTHLGIVAEHLLRTGRRRPWDLIQSVPHHLLTADDLRSVDPDLQSLRNINTPDEYEAVFREILTKEAANGASPHGSQQE